MPIRKTIVVVLAVVSLASLAARTARADLQGMNEYSLEWLVDSSDAIALGDVASDKKADWNRDVADGYQVTEAIKAHKQLRVGQIIKGAPEFGVKGDHAILFMRTTADGGLEVFNAVNFATPFQLRVDDGEIEKDSKEKWQKYLAVDKTGHIISTREELIQRVKERMKLGRALRPGCDRDAVEDEKSVKGGFYVDPPCTYQLAQNGKQLSDVQIILLVPAEPEYKNKAIEAAKGPDAARASLFSHSEQVKDILKANYADEPTDKRAAQEGGAQHRAGSGR